MRVLGIDPGLENTGWGIIDAQGNRLSYVASGIIKTKAADAIAQRLLNIQQGLIAIVQQWNPETAAIEETFVNKNAASSLKLGMARGAAMLAPAMANIAVSEYAANLVKKSLVGSGHADKDQIAHMIRVLLPESNGVKADEADALAVAICHAHHAQSQNTIHAALIGK